MFEENYNSTPASKKQLLRFLEAGRRLPGAASSDEDLLLAPHPLSRSADCPEIESYIALATGAVTGEDAERLLEHASVCSGCAAILSGSLNALEGNPSQEETAAIAELASARMDWQRQKARELAATPAKKRPVLAHPLFQQYGRWVPGAAVAAGLLLAAGLWFWQRTSNTPEHQLAMAYQESRTLELRVPQAGYTALTSSRRTRGAAGDDESPSLLDARARLRRELANAPQNSRWLELQARADILEERYDSAIDVLDRLRLQGPATAELLSDLAMAYYQRGLVSGSDGDRSAALDYLRQADLLAPADPVILFNEAIVMEDRGQMMNAVEVWTRYITLERDALWKAEGQRKLSTLEQTLNRLKSHDSRVNEMLATPSAMNALSVDQQKLALLDEELSSYSLGRLLISAFPGSGANANNNNSERSRGSPCTESCEAARKLLQAIGDSLALEHQDYWLTDLLNPLKSIKPKSPPTKSEEAFEAGLRLLGQAVSDDLTGVPIEAAQKSLDAEKSFKSAGGDARLRLASHVAERRAAVEYLYALQRHVDFQQCREAATHLRTQPENARDQVRYPWMAAQALITEKVCDDTAELRNSGRALGKTAEQIVLAQHYPLLSARVGVMMALDASDSEDIEGAERTVYPILQKLYETDSPPFRIFNTFGFVSLLEAKSQRSYAGELYLQESLNWALVGQSRFEQGMARFLLACAQIRHGDSEDANNQLRMAEEDLRQEAQITGEKTNLSEASEEIAGAMLETGNLEQAKHYLDLGANDVAGIGDILLKRRYAMARGQLELALGHPGQSVAILEQAIHLSEGDELPRADKATSAEFGENDHDAYAELAAAWLSQGRSPESVLALWERFRLRSRGLPIKQCAGAALDCEQPLLNARLRDIQDNILVGQIVLMDRILIYQVDRNGITWTQKALSRQRLLNSATALERAVSSPSTSTETATLLGERLTGELLPALPAAKDWHGLLFLEPDPKLENLPWSVLPTPDGLLGLTYPAAELQSVLVLSKPIGDGTQSARLPSAKSTALVIGASVASEDEPPLPEAVTEAEDVSRLLHSQPPLLGDRATAFRVAQAMSTANIIHFAGHAVQAGNGTELLLAPSSGGNSPSWIDGTFLRQHPPKVCRLAVLSACSTGSLDTAWNHPLQDIVQTIENLGVPEVVATKWQIDSKATVPFMDSFYTNLSTGKSAAVALMLARRVQFAQSTFKNPYYWGAYYVASRDTSQPTGDLHARR
jgi:CHAT domain-containing protein